MRLIKSRITDMYFENKIVLLRIDANVPLKNGKIVDDFKLEKANRTIQYLVQHQACVILLTHLGNPEKTKEDLSTRQLLPWFKQKGYQVEFFDMPDMLIAIQKKPGTIILFENTRLFKEEKNLTPTFAQELANSADYYIFDAFGAIHRNETTISLLPLEFSPEKRTIGFLVEEEYNLLVSHVNNSPSLLIVGGGKPEKKIYDVIACAPYIDTIFLCPLLSTINIPLPGNIVLPIDYLVRKKIKDAQLETINATDLSEHYECIAIGPKTVQLLTTDIKKSQTIIWNGFMGFLDQKETVISSEEIAKTLAHQKGFTIIAGGDTTAFVRSYMHLQDKVSALITGGGATLAIIARKPLPGLESFLKEAQN